MTWRVRVRPEAELDLLFAAGWYEAQRPGLGAEFIQELAGVIVSLGTNALIYAELFDDVRRVFSRRFPYAVAYQILDEDSGSALNPAYAQKAHPLEESQDDKWTKCPRIIPRDLDENTILDLDAKGNTCAITIEHASRHADAPHFSYEQVAA